MGIMAVSAGLLGACSSSRASSSSTQAASSSASSATQGSDAASTATSSSSDAAEASTSTQAANKTLVVVFSWSGNTLAVADRIASDLQTDVFRIEPETPYTKDYNEMLQIAQDEQAANTMPALAANVQAWDSYSTIYLGFPTWWGHLPQIVKSFLATHDCTGKTIYPFNTHAGSGFASCLSDLSAACPGADVREGLSLVGDNVSSSTERIDEWVSTNA
jgi:flavodoxin